jgi:hypothetical protein
MEPGARTVRSFLEEAGVPLIAGGAGQDVQVVVGQSPIQLVPESPSHARPSRAKSTTAAKTVQRSASLELFSSPDQGCDHSLPMNPMKSVRFGLKFGLLVSAGRAWD